MSEHVAGNPLPDCPRCHGSGECSNAQFTCPCRHHRYVCPAMALKGDCDCWPETPMNEPTPPAWITMNREMERNVRANVSEGHGGATACALLTELDAQAARVAEQQATIETLREYVHNADETNARISRERDQVTTEAVQLSGKVARLSREIASLRSEGETRRPEGT